MRINKLCIGVDIIDVLVSQCHPVAPVQGADVVVHRRLHRLPVVFHCVQTHGRQWFTLMTTSDCWQLLIYHSKLVRRPPFVTSWVVALSPHLSLQTPSRTCVHPAWRCPARPSGASASWECSPRSHTFHRDLNTNAWKRFKEMLHRRRPTMHLKVEVSYPRRFPLVWARHSPVPWSSSPT